MEAVSDNRFLYQICAVLGAAILVCGIRLFLFATSYWEASVDVEPAPLATATTAIEFSDRSKSTGPVAALSVSAPVSADPATKDEIKDSGSAPEATSRVEQPQASSEAPQLTASTEEEAQVALKEQPHMTVEARVGDETHLASASTSVAVKEQPYIAAESRVGDQTLLASATVNPADEPVVKDKIESAESAPHVTLSSPAVTAEQGNESLGDKSAGSTPVEQAAAAPVRKQTSQITSRRKPLGLAPVDKPSISRKQGQPRKPEAGVYSAKIWSALARKKPNAGQRGSTTVTFAIGPGGALRFIRVTDSSGNARLDELALATVRNAAPFPPPPQLKDGAAAYTIRIDFR